MSSWPDKPLIRITAGLLHGRVPLRGVLATNAGLGAAGTDFKYQIIWGPGTGTILRKDDLDPGSILAWEEVVPVPAADLERLRDEFRGSTLAGRRLSALLQVTSYVKPSTESPLDQAVYQVETSLSASMTLSDTSSEEYLALLLRAISDFQDLEMDPASPEKGQSLARIVRLSVEWIAATVSPGSANAGREALRALSEVKARVESDPAVGGFPAIAALAGDAAARIDEARESEEGRRRLAEGLAEPVLTIAHYALAQMARSLGRGEGL